ncbi:MAG: imidazole glycerol phosphate synthase subunit HisF [Candidatus Omnitrophica bacterium]|nr:imidazole glycerol phosphate synthase subunit HisF [Candidatus Omnitrophota bacterium]
MLQTRVFPCLLLQGEGLVKTVRFNSPVYIGDPLNAVRIFNTKEVDELLFLDITATKDKRKPNFELIKRISDECTMPLTVGGGISSCDDIRLLSKCGVEKFAINTAFYSNPDFVKEASEHFGSQAIIVSIDVKKDLLSNYRVFIRGGSAPTKIDPVLYAKKAQQYGAGEILLNSIDRDGTMEGFDISLIKKVTEAVNIPVIACGGCGKIEDIASAVKEGKASAVTAGSFFVFHGRRRAVLINFPLKKDIEKALS